MVGLEHGDGGRWLDLILKVFPSPVILWLSLGVLVRTWQQCQGLSVCFLWSFFVDSWGEWGIWSLWYQLCCTSKFTLQPPELSGCLEAAHFLNSPLQCFPCSINAAFSQRCWAAGGCFFPSHKINKLCRENSFLLRTEKQAEVVKCCCKGREGSAESLSLVKMWGKSNCWALQLSFREGIHAPAYRWSCPKVKSKIQSLFPSEASCPHLLS